MRPTDFCFPSLDYEHPYLVGFRARHWDSRPTAATEDSVFHAPTIRFGGLCAFVRCFRTPSFGAFSSP